MARSAVLAAEWSWSSFGEVDHECVLLCVGDLLSDCRFPHTVRYAEEIDIISWPQLAERLSRGLSGGVVFSAALSVNFDCLDIAQLLCRAGFRGQYRIVAPEIPNLGLIRREIAAECPRLDFEIGRTLPAELIRAT